MEKNIRKSHFIESDSILSSNCVIDQRFREIVLTHIISNYNQHIQAPLFLAIHGNPGEGKTFQILQICREYNLKICYYSGAELSGNYERDSIVELADDYTRACNYYHEGEICIIIIDDFHLSPASTKSGVGTTINSQLLTGYLMNLCDMAKSKQIDSIPIILLGNTFKNIYEPLKRDGRMDFFRWEVSYDLKKRIVKELFRNYISNLEYLKIDKFIEKYKEQPISFFAELKNDIEKSFIKNTINQLEKKNIRAYINDCQFKNRKQLNLVKLTEFAERRIISKLNSNEGGEWEI